MTTTHPIATRKEWLAGRLNLLAAEKDLTHKSDELARRRQALPWVPVDKQYRFETDEGAATLGPGTNTCKGVVEEAIYVGDVTRYRVGLGADGAITIKVPNRHAARPLAAGAAIALSWSPDDTRLFSRAAA